jgi:4-amino-4-deoxy-L-arabinose transferase-like glycosyltransferase
LTIPGKQNQPSSTYHLGPITVLGIGITSLIYFADIFIRASQKCFWFDELCTVFLCRLPSLKDAYTTASHGADFNPPLFYALAGLAHRLFGEGLIATRLPEIVAVWLFCLCLFLFVSRRMGPWSGFVAGVLPFFTLVQYYAYEARPHGLVLGWCGLMLVLWQRAKEGRKRALWLTAFGLCMSGALLTHVYAVYLIFPFAAVELYELLSRRAVDWGALAATFLPLSVAAPIYLPLFRVFRKLVARVFFPAAHNAIQGFFIETIGPAGLVLVLAVLLVALCKEQISEVTPAPRPLRQEGTLAVAFATLPLIGWLGAFISHGPYISRYFLASVAGYSMLLAWAVSGPGIRPRAVRILSGSMFLLMILDLAMATHEYVEHNLTMKEISSGLDLTTTPKRPMAPYSVVTTANPRLDILVCPPLEYLYFFNYAPPDVVSRLYYVASAGGYFTNAFAAFEEWGHLGIKMVEIKPFMAAHNHFLVYEAKSGYYSIPITTFLSAGYKLQSAQVGPRGTLYEFER